MCRPNPLNSLSSLVHVTNVDLRILNAGGESEEPQL